jgi:hypothetical protein
MSRTGETDRRGPGIAARCGGRKGAVTIRVGPGSGGMARLEVEDTGPEAAAWATPAKLALRTSMRGYPDST